MGPSGNECFNKSDFAGALEWYDRGLGLAPTTAVLHANRAMVLLKLERFKDAEAACTSCLGCDPAYIKAFSRRATARQALGLSELAKQDLEQVLKLEPTNKSAKEELRKLTTGAAKSASSVKSQEKKVSTSTPAPASAPTASASSSSSSSSSSSKATPSATTATSTVAAPSSTKPVGISLEKASPVAKDAYAGISAADKAKLAPPPSIDVLVHKALTILNTSTTPTPLSVPTNSYEFERQWKELNLKDDAAVGTFLKQIPIPSYSTILANVLTGDILPFVFRMFREHFVTDARQLCQAVVALAFVKRFDVAFMFLEDADRSVIHNLLQVLVEKHADQIAQLPAGQWKQACARYEFKLL
ncbi:hypothetical protein CAOG_003979 [Capsaspora owczarzaki ATCC 30864]|uniref:RNA polymerase II-associated protein 3 n=1 Tax=Capsaspora owczarzaki (strain ATCC 30864) TaxID=595528 RepID=A0A0D2WPB3_CAPO3|nr:hypothetical protein CAOG_003979 [Capsaspora owczarzaki ATCC 30864]